MTYYKRKILFQSPLMMHVESWLVGKKFSYSCNKFTKANDGLAFVNTGKEEKNDNKKREI